MKKNNLLILRGVYLKDLISDSIFEKSDRTSDEPDIVYTDIPKKFTSVKDWPITSNLKCWECDQIPKSYPKFIPVNLDKNENGNEICDVYGHFCEWNCAVRFAMREYPKPQQWDVLQAICIFESRFSGKRREKIMPAPPKTLMKAYCGSSGITARQWREKLNSINADYSFGNYKLEHFTQ